MFDIKFLGVGTANASRKFYNSNLLITSESGKKMLLDCGRDVNHALTEQGEDLSEIDAVFVSHLHSDHAGGIENLAQVTFFTPGIPKPKLFCVEGLMQRLWEETVKGGCSTTQVEQAHLTTYFDCRTQQVNEPFIWEGIEFQPVQMVHVVNGYEFMPNYGLMFHEVGSDFNVFWTSDYQFAPHQIIDFYKKSTLIISDCETYPGFMSRVHAHYDDLKTLDDDIRKKMLLTHYTPQFDQFDAVKDGFLGFANKGTKCVVDNGNISIGDTIQHITTQWDQLVLDITCEKCKDVFDIDLNNFTIKDMHIKCGSCGQPIEIWGV